MEESLMYRTSVFAYKIKNIIKQSETLNYIVCYIIITKFAVFYRLLLISIWIVIRLITNLVEYMYIISEKKRSSLLKSYTNFIKQLLRG